MRPAYITATRSAVSAITPMSCVTSMMAVPCSRHERLQQRDDLRLDRDVERGRRFVGDDQLRLGARAPARSRPAGACRPRTGAGTGRCAGARPGCRSTSSSSIARCARRRARQVEVRLDGLDELPADRVQRIQRRQRVLEDRADLLAADACASPRRRGCRCAARREGFRRRRSRPGASSRPMIAAPVSDLPGARFADHAQHLAGRDRRTTRRRAPAGRRVAWGTRPADHGLREAERASARRGSVVSDRTRQASVICDCGGSGGPCDAIARERRAAAATRSRSSSVAACRPLRPAFSISASGLQPPPGTCVRPRGPSPAQRRRPLRGDVVTRAGRDRHRIDLRARGCEKPRDRLRLERDVVLARGDRHRPERRRRAVDGRDEHRIAVQHGLVIHLPVVDVRQRRRRAGGQHAERRRRDGESGDADARRACVT